MLKLDIIRVKHQKMFAKVALDDKGRGWYVAEDVAKILEYKDVEQMLSLIKSEYYQVAEISYRDNNGYHTREATVINETGIMKLLFVCQSESCKIFRDYLIETIIPGVLKTTGLSNCELLKAATDIKILNLCYDLIKAPDLERVDYIKADNIANLTTSARFKKKHFMYSWQMDDINMLIYRQKVLTEALKLIKISKDYDLIIQTAKLIYDKFYYSEIYRNKKKEDK